MPRKKATDNSKLLGMTVRPSDEQRKRLAQVSADMTVAEGKSVSFPQALLTVLDRYYEEKYQTQRGTKAKS